MPTNPALKELLLELRQRGGAATKLSVSIPSDIVSRAHNAGVPLNSATVQAGLLLLLGSVEVVKGGK